MIVLSAAKGRDRHRCPLAQFSLRLVILITVFLRMYILYYFYFNLVILITENSYPSLLLVILITENDQIVVLI